MERASKRRRIDAGETMEYYWQSTTPQWNGTLYRPLRIQLVVVGNEHKVIVDGGAPHGTWKELAGCLTVTFNWQSREEVATEHILKQVADTDVHLQVNRSPPWQGMLVPIKRS